jgi:hypothetical protein
MERGLHLADAGGLAGVPRLLVLRPPGGGQQQRHSEQRDDE